MKKRKKMTMKTRKSWKMNLKWPWKSQSHLHQLHLVSAVIFLSFQSKIPILHFFINSLSKKIGNQYLLSVFFLLANNEIVGQEYPGLFSLDPLVSLSMRYLHFQRRPLTLMIRTVPRPRSVAVNPGQ